MAVLGDLHVHPDGGAARFWSPAAFASALEDIAGTADAVVLNGDLLDLDRGARPLDFAGALAAIREAEAGWIELLSNPRWLRTHGNHDRWLGVRHGWPDALHLRAGTWRVRIEHGHRFDAPIKRARRFASLVTWCAGEAERRGTSAILSGMRRAETLLTGAGTTGGGVSGRAGRWLGRAADGPDVLVIGHTHQAVLEPVGHGRVLANPGGCLDGTLRWLLVDGEKRVLRLHARRDGVESTTEIFGP